MVGEVEAHGVAGVGDDLEQRRRLAGTRRAPAPLDNEAVLEEIGHERAHGRPGEVGDAGQVRPGMRAVVQQLREHQSSVVTAGVAREGLAPRAERSACRTFRCDPCHCYFINRPN